jgi:hypothetical protein
MKRQASEQPTSSQPYSDLETNQPPKRSKPRRQSSAFRKEMKARGSHNFKVDPLDKLLNPFQRSPDDYNISNYSRPAARSDNGVVSKEHRVHVEQLNTVLRKGVVVTRDTGCLIPHEQYCQRGAGAKVKGYQKFAAVAYGWAPNGGSEGGGRIKNEHGWDSTVEASHLCHRHQCMNPTHLVYEPAWRNRKRNYCGLKAPAGACDCGNEPRCLLRYEPDTSYDQLMELNCSEVPQISSLVLEPLRAVGIPISFDRPTGLARRDVKSDQRKAAKAKRQEAAEKQAYSAAKKAASRTAKQLASKESAKKGLVSPVHKQQIAEASEKAYLKHICPDDYAGDQPGA